MGRPRKNPVRTPDELKVMVAEEREQLAMLQRDLRDALIFGESTRALRGAIADTESSIAALRAAMDEALQAEAKSRQFACATEAEAVMSEASNRYITLLAPLVPAPFPELPKGFHHVA